MTRMKDMDIKEKEYLKFTERLIEFVSGDDMTFFEEHILNLPLDKQEIFWKENPDFLQGFPVIVDSLDLLQDPIYRGLCRKIAQLHNEKGESNE